MHDKANVIAWAFTAVVIIIGGLALWAGWSAVKWVVDLLAGLVS